MGAPQILVAAITIRRKGPNPPGLTMETFPDTTTRTYSWTALDLTRVKDRQNRVTQYTYDHVRNLIQITDPLGRRTTFGYWENGKLKSLTDPKGNTTTWNIDLENRITSKRYADGSQVTYAYGESTDRLTDATDALGQTKQFVYNLDNTVAATNYLHAVNPTPGVTLTYDPYFRRVASMTDGTGTTQYNYWPPQVLGALQLEEEIDPFRNATIAYQYDQLGRLASRTVDSSTESFTYDDLGRVVGDANDLGIFTMGYLGQTSQITSRMLQGSTVFTGWVYDTNQNDRRLKQINNSNATRSYTFTTTPEDLISQIQESEPQGGQWPPQTWNYNYDASNRLLQAMGQTARYAYGYDPADNITSFEGPWGMRSASYNSLNEITSFNNDSYTYDANGSLLDDGVRRYSWDAQNRLISVTSNRTGQTTTFRYDGLSRRVSMISSGSGTSGNYLWCGDTLCQARSLSDNVLRHYFSEGEYVLAGMQRLYYSQDQLGSVRDVLLQNGQRTAATDYEPYGTISQTVSGTKTDFRYAGLFYDQQDDLYLATYRAFDGVTGRFIDRDPVNEMGGLNLYGYATVDPEGFTDVLGLCACNQAAVPQGPNSHYYSNTSPICAPGIDANCTVSNVYNQLLSNAAPGQDEPAVQGHKILVVLDGMVPLGFITQDVDPLNLSVTNITVPGQHLLDPGSVTRCVIVSGSFISIQTVGQGTGRWATLNGSFGSLPFRNLDIKIHNNIVGDPTD